MHISGNECRDSEASHAAASASVGFQVVKDYCRIVLLLRTLHGVGASLTDSPGSNTRGEDEHSTPRTQRAPWWSLLREFGASGFGCQPDRKRRLPRRLSGPL